MPAVLERRSNGCESENKSDFRLEYDKNASEKALFDDVVSFLGEYRFNLLKSPYELKYSGGKLRNRHTGEAMLDLTQKALNKKTATDNNYSRELEENKGIKSLDWQLSVAKEGDTIAWASPPGPKEEGYGNYGFIFIGNVYVNNSSEKTVQMTAIRLEGPKIEQFNKAIYLLTGEKIDYKSAEEFLAHPKVISENLKEEYVDAILEKAFGFKPNPAEKEMFELIIRQMSPLISEFIKSAKDPRISKTEKLKELYVLENYFLKLKKDYAQPEYRRENFIANFKARPRLPEIRDKYGFEPPKVAGSCPANNKNKNSLTSSNLLSRNSFLNDLFSDQEWFHCPKCDYQADGPIGDTCPECGLTKQKYAEETGVSCD